MDVDRFTLYVLKAWHVKLSYLEGPIPKALSSSSKFPKSWELETKPPDLAGINLKVKMNKKKEHVVYIRDENC